MVTKWEYWAVVEEEIIYEEGGNNETIKAPPFTAAQSVQRYYAYLNWIDNIGLQYWQGMSVLQ